MTTCWSWSEFTRKFMFNLYGCSPRAPRISMINEVVNLVPYTVINWTEGVSRIVDDNLLELE